jgi:hypothetical protein
VDQYVTEHSNFLAMKLVPGANVQAMRPVRITSPGASTTLPLRMIAAGSGANVGLTLWVVGEGRYEPKNFGFFTIAASEVTWDWTTNSSDYTTIRAQKTAASNGTAWQIESSTDVQTLSVTNTLNFGPGANPGPGIDPSMVDYPPTPADPTTGAPAQSSDDLRQADLAALFPPTTFPDGTARVTRVRADLAHAALGQDLNLGASDDQSQLSGQLQVTKEANQPQCPVFTQTCGTMGTAPRDMANAMNAALVDPMYLHSGDPGSQPTAAAPISAVGTGSLCSTSSKNLADWVAGGVVAFFGIALLRSRKHGKGAKRG